MYSGTLHRSPFVPDPSRMQHASEREEYTRRLLEANHTHKEKPPVGGEEGLRGMLERICPEDSALLSLILFLLCDNTNNDVVLLGILLYVLLSK